MKITPMVGQLAIGTHTHTHTRARTPPAAPPQARDSGGRGLKRRREDPPPPCRTRQSTALGAPGGAVCEGEEPSFHPPSSTEVHMRAPLPFFQAGSPQTPAGLPL